MPLVDPVTMSGTSTTSTTAPSTTSSSSKGDTTTHPLPAAVPVHPTTASRAARHVLPALLAALFYAAFPRLVADPVAALWASLPVVTLLQVLYAFVCLPLAGSGAAAAKSSRKHHHHRQGDKKKDGAGPNFVIVRTVFVAASVCLLPRGGKHDFK